MRGTRWSCSIASGQRGWRARRCCRSREDGGGVAVAAERRAGEPGGQGVGGGDGGMNLVGADVEEVERAGHTGWALAGDVGVHHGGLETFVAQEQLDGADVDAAFEQVSGEAVTKRVTAVQVEVVDPKSAALGAAETGAV